MVRLFSIYSLSIFLFSFSFLSVQATDLKLRREAVEVFEHPVFASYFFSEKGYEASSDLPEDSFDYANNAYSSDSAEEGESLEEDAFLFHQNSSLSSQEGSSSEIPLEVLRFGPTSEGEEVFKLAGTFRFFTSVSGRAF